MKDFMGILSKVVTDLGQNGLYMAIQEQCDEKKMFKIKFVDQNDELWWVFILFCVLDF